MTADSVVVGKILNGAHGSNNRASVIDVLITGVLDKSRVHSLNPGLQLVLGHPSSIAKLLLANILADWSSYVKLERHIGLEQVI